MNCPQCHYTLRDGARFCDNCGLSISSANMADEQTGGRGIAGTMPANDPLIGSILESKYQLDARLGEGAMGAVYRARRLHIGDEVAVKVLHKEYVADASAIERFRREARAAAMLHHPNIVTVHDFGEARGDNAPAFIVMELVRGTPLRKLLKREGRLSPERAIYLMRAICAAVGAAHRSNVVHRDLKPDNIIVLPPDDDDERERVKVVDFGIAKLRDTVGGTLTRTGVVMGTPYYMSPEQCRGESLDARADVYSLGVILYEMLVGTPPFMAETFTGVITQHLYEEPPPLPLELHAPPALEAVYLRALSKEPKLRQADATILAREVQVAREHYHRQEEEAKYRREAEDRQRLDAETGRRRAEEDAHFEELARAEERRRQEEAGAAHLLESARLREEEARRQQAQEERIRLEQEAARRIAEVERERKAEEQRRRTDEATSKRTNDAWRAGTASKSGDVNSSPVAWVVGGLILIFIIIGILFWIYSDDTSSANASTDIYNTNTTTTNGNYTATVTNNNSIYNANASTANSSEATAHYNRASDLFSQKRYAEAEQEAREAVRLSPNSAFYHNMIAVSLNGQKKYAAAEAEDREAIRLDPNKASYHANLGIDLNWQKKYADAEKEYLEALRLEPNNARYHLNRGKNLTWLQRFAEAKAEYKKALELDPNNTEARAELNKIQ